MRRCLALAPVLLAIAGCGNERAPAPELTVVPAKEAREHRFPAAGLRVSLPANVTVVPSRSPGVLRGFLGEAFVSAFAYRRREQLPRNAGELEAARKRLVRAVRRRSKGYELISSRRTRVDGARAIELLGDQTFSRRRLRTRSLHAFRGSGEYVIELAVPVGDFRRIDRAVLPLLRRTLDLSGRIRRRG